MNRVADEGRPDPDALVVAARRERGGGLKVFLGAAPGVGKTYRMLQEAREARARGVDVVVGVAEAHGRAETEALLEGLEVLAPARLEHRGREFAEFDLDAALARRPAILVVDELAHRNIPGSRHARRHQDIEELLDNGIDVWTALNVQHLESLEDVVARITGQRMRETVPDALLEKARDVVLVDLAPAELIERLRRGKVYVPEQARAALEGYFSLSNLAALRELSAHAIAERLDADVRTGMQSRGVGGPWPVRTRLMVVLDARRPEEALLRTARRAAARQRAPWSAVAVDDGGLDAHERERLERTLGLAERQGATRHLLRGHDEVEELLAFARERNVTAMVLGHRPRRGRLSSSDRVARGLLRRADAFELTFVPVPAAPRALDARRLLERLVPARAHGAVGPGGARDHALALASVAAATGAAATMRAVLSIEDLSLIFLTAVLGVATRTGVRPALTAAVGSFLAYNFFFTDPVLDFTMRRAEQVVTVTLFLFVAIVGGQLAGRLRERVGQLRATNDQTDELLEFAKRLAAAPDEAALRGEAVQGLAAALCVPVALLEADPESGAARVVATTAQAPALDAGALSAALWSVRNHRPSGRDTDTLGGIAWRFEPLGDDAASAQGVVGFLLDEGGADVPPDSTLEAYAHLLGLALQRVRLADSLSASRVAEETERLRSALLSSISHDLRTPLAAMIGAASSVRSLDERLSATDRRSLLDSVVEEGERLDRYIRNLLDMTRLGQGTLRIERDWIHVTDLLAAALRRTSAELGHVRVEHRVAPGLPALHVHPALVEQALVNVLENAAKFAPEGSTVRIDASREGEELALSVTDRGPGIPPDQRRRVFEMFFTGGDGDRGRHGSGLGLSICRGMIGAHGGRIEALAGPDGVGTRIVVHLPFGAPAPESVLAPTGSAPTESPADARSPGKAPSKATAIRR